MCGINGYIHVGSSDRLPEGIDTVSLAARQGHRGPDGFGMWSTADGRVALGHRRLAILDLSEQGAQPMRSKSGRFVITFNGEIYNFRELAQSLTTAGHVFTGTSDTEVMLAAFEEWGIEAALRLFNGMFAFAVWDAREARLTLARDRLGQKPLYLRAAGSLVEFGSELRVCSSLDRESRPGPRIDREAVVHYLRHSYVPGPRTIWADTWKLPAGTLLEVDRDGTLPFDFRPRPYWSLRNVISEQREQLLAADIETAATLLESALRDAVARQLVSDVPIGAFLSGGVDSSVIVALMREVHNDSTRTFTIGFEDEEYDEAPFARRVAEFLGTDHTEHYVSPEEALAVVEKLPMIFDEPFADSSQIPTYLVADVARKHVKVALSGDGGDELFGGYRRYQDALQRWGRLQRSPWILRESSRLALRVPVVALRAGFWAASPFLPRRLRSVDPVHQMRRYATSLGATTPQALYETFLTHASDAEALVIGSPACVPHISAGISLEGATFAEWMMFTDATNYLPDDIHTKVDRATMAVSLEARAPFMDPAVVELACRMPPELKLGSEGGKLVLRRVLSRLIPKTLFDRPKRGFGIPLSSWLRGPLREWADCLLDREMLTKQGIFEPDPILRRWASHRSGSADWGYHLWDVLMFQAWYERYGPLPPLAVHDLQPESSVAHLELGSRK